MEVLPRIKNIIQLEPSFWERDEKIEDIFTPLASIPHSVLLLSGGDGDCSRYSFAGIEPFLIVQCWRDLVEIKNKSGKTVRLKGNPFDIVQSILDHLKVDTQGSDAPFCAGAMGYWGYDLRYQLERLPDIGNDDLLIPDLYLVFPSVIITLDRDNNHFVLNLVETDIDSFEQDSVSDKVERLIKWSRYWHSHLFNLPEPVSKGKYETNFTKEEYIEAIDKTRDYIRHGHIYQVNISQRFTFPFEGSDYLLFRKLFRLNPASFFAYMNCGDFTVLSTSPERFIYRNGDYIETRPIKGTRPRGKTPDEDEKLQRELIESWKEDAELSMIVDLLRNDLGKVCLPGTVKVKEHKRIEAYQNVFHLVSIVEGRLPEHCRHMDILKAVFPGGSITGCPKVRAMEIIEELETVKRNIYTGSIGYVGLNGTMDLNIAIRTAIRKGDKLYLSVGGGIVYGSEPEAEYMETIHKGETFLQLLS